MKNQKMTKAEAEAWKKRWRLVNELEVQELRSTSMDLKVRQLGTLMRLAFHLGWVDKLAAEEQEVRSRWQRLRKGYGF